MKVKYSINLLIAYMLLITACKKNGNGVTDTPVTKPKKYLTHMVTVSTTTGPGGTSTTSTTQTYYTYDSQKRLITAKTGVKTNTFAYYDDGNLYTITKTNTTLPTWSVIEFTYASGRLTQYTARAYNASGIQSESPYVYVYDGDKVSEIHASTYVEKFTYDKNGNILNVYHDEGTSYYSFYYAYDDKKSMFVNSLLKFPTVSNTAGYVDSYLYDICFSFNTNNTSVVYGDSLGKNVDATFTYNYDDDGYPTGAVLTPAAISGSPANKYTFEYSTLQ